MSDWALLISSGLMLYLGAEWFVAGASGLALSLRVPQLLVGLTVVAYGTSAPEIIVGIQAARAGHGDVALGNVIGSNIANIGLILGTAALIRPARVHAALRRRELPVLLATTAVVPLLLLDGVVGSWEASGLLAIAVAYTAWMVRSEHSQRALRALCADARGTQEAADLAGAPKPVGTGRAATAAAVGLLVLLVSGSFFVDGAVAVARSLGMSDRLVGFTIVALGTSLPELVTSVIAARRGHSDLAVGNVVGSNIFNVLLCLSSAALAGSVAASLASLSLHILALLTMTACAAVFLRSERTITRAEGALVLALYASFMVVLVVRG